MRNLGTAAAATTAALMLGNLLSIPLLRPLGLRLLALMVCVGLTATVFGYVGHRFNPTMAWLAASLTLALTLTLLGVLT
jgi:hypothetical protein